MPGPGKPFQPGNNANPNGRAGKSGAGGVGKVRPPLILRDMRWVYEHEDEADDTTPGRRMQRRLLKEDPGRFVERLLKAEREWASVARTAGKEAPTPSTGGNVPEPDEGSERQREILNEWLNDPRNWDPAMTALHEENERLRQQLRAGCEAGDPVGG